MCEYAKRRRPVTWVTGRLRVSRCTRSGLRAPRRSRRCGARCKDHYKPAALPAALFVRRNEEIGAVLAAGRGAHWRRPIRCGRWRHCVLRALPGGGRRRRRVDVRCLSHGLCLLHRRGDRPNGINGGTDRTERRGRGTHGSLCRARRDLGRRTRAGSDSLGFGRGGRRREQRRCRVLRRTWRRRRLRVHRLRGARESEKRNDHRASGGRHGITVTLGGV